MSADDFEPCSCCGLRRPVKVALGRVWCADCYPAAATCGACPPYRSRQHPRRRVSRKLAALPPPAPRGAPTGRTYPPPRPLAPWLAPALAELRAATVAMYAAAYEFRRMRLELEAHAGGKK